MIIAVDTETTGLNPYLGAKPFAISTYGSKDLKQYIAIGEDNLVPFDLAMINPKIEKVFHNAKFDIQMLKTYGMEVKGPIHDTMIMAHIYNPDESSKQLKRLAEKYLGADAADEKALKEYMRKHKLGMEYAKAP